MMHIVVNNVNLDQENICRWVSLKFTSDFYGTDNLTTVLKKLILCGVTFPFAKVPLPNA